MSNQEELVVFLFACMIVIGALFLIGSLFFHTFHGFNPYEDAQFCKDNGYDGADISGDPALNRRSTWIYNCYRIENNTVIETREITIVGGRIVWK